MSSTAKKIKISFKESYVAEILKKYKTGVTTEATYYPALSNLIEESSKQLQAINQPKRIKCGAPDFAILRGDNLIGHIEAKDLGVDLNIVEASEQLLRYKKSLPNLILTNYLEFRFYKSGNLIQTYTIGKINKKNITIVPEYEEVLGQLCNSVLISSAEKIISSKVLTEKLASLTLIVKDVIQKTFNLNTEDKDWLKNWLLAFREVLIDQLTEEEFADMFAQTLTYGFFAARFHHDEKIEFSRFNCAKILPQTNPFLRKLFAQFAGIDMPETISWAVDEIINTLKATDIHAIKKEFESLNNGDDPVVYFYESFLKEYNPKLREARGVYYTPKDVVDFMVKSVDDFIKTSFNKPDGITDKEILILDPATGTASFLHSVISLIHKEIKKKKIHWNKYVEDILLKKLYGFEILMAPYSIAHLKVGMLLQESGYKFNKNERLGIYLTNTLEESAKKTDQFLFEWLSNEANSASDIKSEKPIMVILGNPPYSGQSMNQGDWINNLIKGFDTISKTKTENYFECDGKPLNEKNSKWLNDDYVKFIRFSQWRIDQTGYGVIALITNHGFLENPTFRGMRESLLSSFDEIRIMDLHGNLKKKKHASELNDENVFDIQQGVSISFLIKKKKREEKCKVYQFDLVGTRDFKYDFLKKHSISDIDWAEIEPATPHYLFCKSNNISEDYDKAISLQDIFPVNSVGVTTARDHFCIDFNLDVHWKKIKKFMNMDIENARAEFELGKDARDWKVEYAQDDLANESLKKEKIVPILYRPFDVRFTYYTGHSKGFHCMPRGNVMWNMLKDDNKGLVTTRSVESGKWNHFLTTDKIIQHHTVSSKEVNYLFPLYLYKEVFGKLERSFNLNESLVEKCKLQFECDEDDVFHYITGILTSNLYKKYYAEELLRDFPRIPFTNNAKYFKKISSFGKKIFQLNNCNFECEIITELFDNKDLTVTTPRYDSKTKRLYLNEEAYFDNIREDVWNYNVGGYACIQKWISDRKGVELDFEQIQMFQKTVSSISILLKEIKSLDEYILNSVGGFPLVGTEEMFSKITEVSYSKLKEVDVKLNKELVNKIPVKKAK